MPTSGLIACGLNLADILSCGGNPIERGVSKREGRGEEVMLLGAAVGTRDSVRRSECSESLR